MGNPRIGFAYMVAECMPFTLSHPAAVIPMLRYVKTPMGILALLVGSVSPDIGYYCRAFDWATNAHSLLGSGLICVPSGMVMMGIILFLRKRVLFLMPYRHREAVAPFLNPPDHFTPKLFLVICFLLWIGAVTHIGWDAFTHRSGWFVMHIPVLSKPQIIIGDTSLPVFYLLQQASTVMGLLCVVIFYYRRVASIPKAPGRASGDIGRYIFWMVMLVISVLSAFPLAMREASQYEGYLAVRSVLFQMAIFSGGIFVALTGIILFLTGWLPGYRLFCRNVELEV